MGMMQRSILLAWLFTSVTLAQDVFINHDAWWRIEGRDATIYVSQINNFAAEETGPLYLSLYAQSGSVYSDGQPPGQLITRVPLESIPGNGQVDALTVTSRARAVRPGLKHTALMLEQKAGRRYSIVQWIAFTSAYNVVRKQNGGVGSDDFAIGAGDISVNSVGISVQRQRATFFVDQIKSLRPGGQTGDNDTGILRLAVYATPAAYEGGPIEGQLIGNRVLGRLAPGDYFTGLQGTIKVKKPRGRDPYYTTLVLEEEQESGFVPYAWASAPPQ